jgi:hypothetical protein
MSSLSNSPINSQMNGETACVALAESIQLVEGSENSRLMPKNCFIRVLRSFQQVTKPRKHTHDKEGTILEGKWVELKGELDLQKFTEPEGPFWSPKGQQVSLYYRVQGRPCAQVMEAVEAFSAQIVIRMNRHVSTIPTETGGSS